MEALSDSWPLVVQTVLLAIIFPLVVVGDPHYAPALLLLPMGWAIRAWRRLPLAGKTPFNVPILLLSTTLLFSVLVTPDIIVSYPKAAGVLFGVALLLVWAEWASRPGQIRWVAGAFAALGTGLALVSLFATDWPTKFTLISKAVAVAPAGLVKLPGAQEGIHPNEVAGALLWTLPMGVCLSLRWMTAAFRHKGMGDVWRWGRALLALLVLAALPLGVFLLTQSRTGLIGLAATLALGLFIFLPRWWKLAVPLLIIAALAVGYRAYSTLLSAQPYDPNSAYLSTGTLQFRLVVWAQAIKGIEDFPLTGMGIGFFRKALPPLYPTPQINPAFDVGHAHNLFLQAGVDLGLPGMAAYVAIWLTAFLMLVKIYRAPGPHLRGGRWIVVGLATGLFGHLVYGLTDAIALGARAGFIWWLMLGISAGVYIRSDQDRKPVGQARIPQDDVMACASGQREK